jgi:hypothetical protein
MKQFHYYYPQRVRRHTIKRLSMSKEKILVVPESKDFELSVPGGSETTLTSILTS